MCVCVCRCGGVAACRLGAMVRWSVGVFRMRELGRACYGTAVTVRALEQKLLPKILVMLYMGVSVCLFF